MKPNRLFICAVAISILFNAAPATANDLYCSANDLLPYVEKIESEQARDVSIHELFANGQYTLVVNSFLIGETPIDESNLGLLMQSLYRSRQLCPDFEVLASSTIKPYADLIMLLENTLDAEELDLLADMWSEKHGDKISLDVVKSHLFEVFGLSAVSRVQTILLHMNAGAEAASTKSIMKSLQALGIQIIFIDGQSETSIDDVVDEHNVDLIVSDGTPHVSEANLHKVYLIGKAGENSWSMSFDKEISYAISHLQQRERNIQIYSMMPLPLMDSLIALYPEMTLHQFKDFADANNYFKSKVCDRNDEGCISSLNNSVSLVIGNAKQTAFINSFLRIAQDSRNNKRADAKVYITSAATWGGITSVERHDLSNTLIFDAKRISAAGAGYTQSDRITALIRDIISIYESQSVGVNYIDIPYLGLSGTYYLRQGRVIREIDVIEFSNHASE